MKFLVIGGNAAGMSAASRAKRLKPELEVTVLEQGEDVSYGACGLPYNLADPDRQIDDLVVRSAQMFRDKNDIDLRTGWQVTQLDPKNKQVSGRTSAGEAFSLPYDKLLLATGAAPIVPDLPGFDLPGVVALKSLEDGRRIKQRLPQVGKAVIIGMGYIGLEMAEALHARGIAVEMIEALPKLQPWFADELSALIAAELQAKGVALHLGQKAQRIEADGERLRVVCDDVSAAGDLVLVAIGVRPNSGLAAEAGLQLGARGAIAVDATLQTSDADIYAAGDCADAFHALTGRRVWIPLALRANRAGWAVADNVCGERSEVPPLVGTAVFRIFDLEVARSGINAAEAQDAGFLPAEVTITTSSRAHAFPGAAPIAITMIGDKASGRLLGVQMVGREGVAQRIDAAAVALQAQLSVEQFASTDMAYAPPFSPAWDPLLVAANQLLKKL